MTAESNGTRHGFVRAVELVAALIAIASFVFAVNNFEELKTKARRAMGIWTIIEDREGDIWTASISESNIYRIHDITGEELTDFSFEAVVRAESSSSEYHGLVVRNQDDDYFYCFRINPEGNLKFEIWSPDGPEILMGPVSSTAIHRGTQVDNQLRVEARGQKFDLFVNDEKIGSVHDSTYKNGNVGFFACTCAGSDSSQATFSDPKVEGVQ